MPAFTPGNIVVYRVGDGTMSLASSALTVVFLDEYTSSGALVQSIQMPMADAGANQTLTASAGSNTEGLLTRSADGRYLVLTGYDGAPGSPGVGSTSGPEAIHRVIGRVDAAGNIDTTTTVTSFNNQFIRSAASTDGRDFWAVGGSDGIVHTTFGTSAAQTSVNATQNSGYGISVYDSQLYFSTLFGSVRIAEVGSGTPITPGQVLTQLPGVPTSGIRPYQFVLLDRDAGVAGVDTLYYADDSGVNGGMYKYSFDGANWTSRGSSSFEPLRGLTGSVTGATATFYGTTTENNANRIVSFVDTAAFDATIAGSFTTIATAAVNTAFRGVAFAPLAATPGTDGNDIFTGTAADNAFDGMDGNDLFFLQQGGADTATGGAGNDGFYFGAALDGNDMVDGGAGDGDQVALQGAYGGVTLDGANFTGVETFALLSGGDARFGDTANDSYDYLLTLTGAWSGRTVFNGNSLQVGEDMIIDASATTSGSFSFFGGASVESLIGGGENDGFFFAAGTFDPLDFVDGGGGTDNQFALRGDFAGAAAVTFGTGQLTNIHTIAVISSQDARYGMPGDPPFSYNLTFQNGTTPGVDLLTVTGAGLVADEVLIANGAQEASNAFRFIGGAGADQLIGGTGDDFFFGGLGADQMVGNSGVDTFIYTDTAQSTTVATDVIGQFRSDDRIDVSAIDADTITGGNQDFTFIGSQAFSGTAGELRVVSRGGQDYDVFADTDGDGDADFALLITGAFQGAPAADNFLGLDAPVVL